MILLRGLAILIGLGAIAAVTYGTVEATGGIGTDTAPLYIALGALQAAIALSFAVIHSRIVAALAILVLVACEAAPSSALPTCSSPVSRCVLRLSMRLSRSVRPPKIGWHA